MKKIISISDFKPVLLFDEGVFLRKDLRIFFAASSDEMLNIHRRENADLLIMDLAMRATEGDALCKAIRAEEALRHVAIIITCSGEPGEVARCGGCGANAVIEKPVNAEELFRTIMRLLYVAERGSLREITRVDVKGAVGPDYFFSVSLNLSSSGMLIETDRRLELGDQVTCSFVLDHMVTAEAEVVRIYTEAPERYQYGIRFVDLDPHSKAHIEQYIGAHQRRT